MFHIVIPARFGSTRLPGKALLPIADKPMVAWVWERAMQAGGAQVVVATDDQRIADEMTSRGAQVAMTRADHASGTDRLAEVVEQLGWEENAIVVNVQGDEPLMPVANIQRVAAMLNETQGADMATLMEPLAPTDAEQQSVVKVVASETGRALYFRARRFLFTEKAGCRHPCSGISGFTPTGRVFSTPLWVGPLRRQSKASRWSNCARWPTMRIFRLSWHPRPCPRASIPSPDLAAVRALLGAEQ
ncbi:MAG: hypothetical protein CM15mP103_10440 [Gammaproteobacteria bacterium]|nr:MAG: hypothetical protein CM15mP103_10440 [Gammaproteobacteria bacterium]